MSNQREKETETNFMESKRREKRERVYEKERKQGTKRNEREIQTRREERVGGNCLRETKGVNERGTEHAREGKARGEVRDG